MKSVIRKFIWSQRVLSNKFDLLLPLIFRIDGNNFFLKHVVPMLIQDNSKIVEVGGGKNPILSAEEKKRRNITVIGVDIDHEELKLAPAGTYNQIIVADITKYREALNADLVICQSVMEHVADARGAFMSLQNMVRSGGLVALFLPSRNAVFARLNLLLPQEWKRKILFSIFPETSRDQGFQAYYNMATPREYRNLAFEFGFDIISQRSFFISSYFSFFFPLYFVWRIWILLYYLVKKDDAAETFMMVLRKR